MKTKITISTGVYLLLTILNTAYAMTKDSTIAQDSDPDGLGEIFFVLTILILLLLALWILKNTYRLKENVDSKELDSKDWLNNHIKDMEPDQLTTLINRGNTHQ
jgi:cyanate permease